MNEKELKIVEKNAEYNWKSLKTTSKALYKDKDKRIFLMFCYLFVNLFNSAIYLTRANS